MLNRCDPVDQTGKKKQMFWHEPLTGCGEGGGLEHLDTEEPKNVVSFLEITFQHLLNNLFPIHEKLVQQIAS